MIRRVLLIFFCLLVRNGFCQDQDIVISVDQVAKGFDIYAFNNTDVQHEVSVKMEVKNLRGYTRPFTTLVPAQTKVLIEQLFFLPNKQGTYSFDYTYKRLPNSEEKMAYENALLDNVLDNHEDIEKGIVVFSKDGCPRCHYTTSYLVDNDIDFKFIDVVTGSDEHKLMWALIKKLKPAGSTVVMPVILIDGEISYSIKDLKNFVENLK